MPVCVCHARAAVRAGAMGAQPATGRPRSPPPPGSPATGTPVRRGGLRIPTAVSCSPAPAVLAVPPGRPPKSWRLRKSWGERSESCVRRLLSRCTRRRGGLASREPDFNTQARLSLTDASSIRKAAPNGSMQLPGVFTGVIPASSSRDDGPIILPRQTPHRRRPLNVLRHVIRPEPTSARIFFLSRRARP